MNILHVKNKFECGGRLCLLDDLSESHVIVEYYKLQKFRDRARQS